MSIANSRLLPVAPVLAAFWLAATCASSSAALIGHWNFNEGSGSTALDSSGNGYNGALNGNTTYTPGPPGNFTTPNFGTALAFDGNGDYVEILGTATAGHPLALAGTPYTIAFWLRYNGGSRFITKDDGLDLDGGYGLRTADSSTLSITHLNGGGPTTFNGDTGVSLVGAPNWVHFAATFDGTTLRAYSNGVEGFSTLVGPLTDDAADPDPLQFGGLSLHSQWLLGTLDDVRIYNHALSAAEVRALAVPEPGTVAALLAGGILGLLRRRLR
jgi:hypothetical protein